MIKVVMDSCGDLPADLLAELDIRVIPINIHLGDHVYRDRIDIDHPTFFRQVADEKVAPMTAQPSPHQFAEFYRQVAHETGATDIISINITGELSGTHNSSLIAAQEVSDFVIVHPFDSRSGSGGQGFMALEAARMATANASTSQILNRLQHLRDNMNVFVILDTLDYARMSGRVGALTAALASKLKIKPLVQMRDGVMEVCERVRTKKRAVGRMIALVKEKIGDRPAKLAVIHAEAPEAADNLLKLVQSEFQIDEVFVESASLGIAIHLGPGAVGLVACPAE